MDIKKFSLLILILFLFTPLYSYADIVKLKNGDVITGNVEFKNNGITVQTDYSGELFINFNKIKSLEFTRKDLPARVEETHDSQLLAIFKESKTINENIYPNAGFVYLLDEGIYLINNDNTAEYTERQIFKVLKERGIEEANVLRTYDKYDEQVNIIHARAISPDGKIANLRDDAIKVTDRYADYPLYNRIYNKQFSVPEVKEGTIVDVKIQTKYKNIKKFLKPTGFLFYFRSPEPAILSAFTLKYPENQKIHFKNFLVHQNQPVVAKKEKGWNIIKWEMKNLEEIISEPFMPPYRDINSRVQIAAAFTYEEICEELRRRIETSIDISPEMKKQIAYLTRYTKDDREKAKKIYNFLTGQIRKVNTIIDITNYYPTKPSVIFKEKYGNQLDRAVLLMSMLRVAGINATLALGRPIITGAIDTQFPDIGDFTAIAVIVNNKDWLYPGAEYYSYGILPSFYQNSPFINIYEKKPQIIISPVNSPEPNSIKESCLINIKEDGSAKLRINAEYKGAKGADFREWYKNLKPVERSQNFENIAANIIKGAKMTNYTISDLANLDETVKYSIDIQTDNFASLVGGKYLLVQIPSVYSAMSTAYVAKEDRKFDIFYDELLSREVTVIINLPQNYTISYIPSNYYATNGYIESKIDITKGGNKVKFFKKFSINKHLVPLKDFPVLKRIVENTGRYGGERIILEKI